MKRAVQIAAGSLLVVGGLLIGGLQASAAESGSGTDGTRVTDIGTDGTRVTGFGTDGTRVTGFGTDGTRVT